MSSQVDLPNIRAAEWSVRLGTIGEIVTGVDDVEQCLSILLNTPKGSVPHRPEFGCDAWQWLDQPLAAAQPHVVREVVDAIAQWEPRAELLGVTVKIPDEGAQLGTLTVTVVWRPKLTDQADGSASGALTTSIDLGGAAAASA